MPSTPERGAARASLSLTLLAILGTACGHDLAGLGRDTSAVTETAWVIDDFAGGVAQANHPAGAGAFCVWYDARDNAFGTPSAVVVGGDPAMRIDDAGFGNGVYAIYDGAVPADRTYRLRVRLRVIETGGNPDGIRAFQVGVAVAAAAQHRGPNPSAVAPLGPSGAYAGLTSADDTAAGPQVVITDPFLAHAGDDLLVGLVTDVRSGAWNGASATWSGSHVIVHEIELVASETSEFGSWSSAS
jgi:hypothetical protein